MPFVTFATWIAFGRFVAWKHEELGFALGTPGQT